MAEGPRAEGGALDLLEQAMAQPAAAREDWIRSQPIPAGVRDRALALLALSEAAHLMLPTGGAPRRAGVAPLPERIGAYRVTGLIGEGGMGAVYRGERASGDFEHTAAIKVIRPGALSAQLIERFRRERQTLARLAHPNIARLFDGGETEAGEPFIVMEFVEGRPLLDWLEARPRSKAERLRLFLAAASAVAFAHQNLVVHGDVTPANILVDAEDRPKLIDFGIARPTLDEAAAAGFRVGPAMSLTEGYAAPERLQGVAATTLSDIYALGKVLDRLGEGLAPDPELRAIVRRATAADPAQRYPTVDALRGDVAAYLDGFPVAAVGRGRDYVFRKFVARHRLGVGAAVSASVLLLAALGVTLAANAREQAARAEAEARFQQTRQIARTMLFDAYDEVSKVQGGTEARATLAKTGLTYLDALAADAKAPLDVRLEVGRGYTRLAQVTGSGGESQLGKLTDSNALLAKAETVLKRAYAEDPQDEAVRRAYANLLVEQAGVNLYNNNEIALARRQAQAARTMLQPLARSQPEAARLYAIALQSEGDSFSWDSDYAQARRVLLEAESFMAGLPAPLAADLGVRKTRSAVLRLLAEAQHNLKDDGAAIASLDKAVAINEGLLAETPSDPALTRKLAMSLWYRAVVLREAEQEKQALASISRSVTLARGALTLDQKDAGALHLFGVVAEVQAQVLGDLGRFAESYAIGQEVVDAHRRTVARSDGAAGARRSLATTLITIGSTHYNGADYPQACAHWGEASSIFRDLHAKGVLTGHDRDKTWPEVRKFLASNCEAGPPRAGIKGKL